jgi:hypothetical protein
MWTYEIKDFGFNNKGCDVLVMYGQEKVTVVTLPSFERAVEFLLSHQQYTKHGVIYG